MTKIINKTGVYKSNGTPIKLVQYVSTNQRSYSHEAITLAHNCDNIELLLPKGICEYDVISCWSDAFVEGDKCLFLGYWNDGIV